MRNEAHDLFFSENYETIQRWALQITRQDHDIAQDLIHDLYVKFVQSSKRSETGGEHGYLYVALKNQHISYLRREAKHAASQLSLSDGDLNESELIRFDPRTANKIADELRAICEFACSRKVTSMSASILILRFFHGYFPAEVARMVNRPINSIEVFLRTARRETRRYLAYLQIGDPAANKAEASKSVTASGDEILKELRSNIFSAVQFSCLPRNYFKKFYSTADRKMDREELSHIVSCRKCLENINELLCIPTLRQRHPLDTVGLQRKDSLKLVDKSKAAGVGFAISITMRLLEIDWSLYGTINFL
ncbi:MAG: RNA polymerase sigma factor [Pyrinomonadaceae bacterium]